MRRPVSAGIPGWEVSVRNVAAALSVSVSTVSTSLGSVSAGKVVDPARAVPGSNRFLGFRLGRALAQGSGGTRLAGPGRAGPARNHAAAALSWSRPRPEAAQAGRG